MNELGDVLHHVPFVICETCGRTRERYKRYCDNCYPESRECSWCKGVKPVEMFAMRILSEVGNSKSIRTYKCIECVERIKTLGIKQGDIWKFHWFRGRSNCSCGSKNDFYLGKRLYRDGSVRLAVFCSSCHMFSDLSKKTAIVNGMDINKLPVIHEMIDHSCAVRYCERMDTQLHHFGPRHVFATDSDNWPTVYLCSEHHKEWHDKVTPNMTQKHQTVL